MKKVLILALTLFSMTIMAQEKERAERPALSAEQLATLQTKRMTLALDLNEAQQTQVKALQLEQAKYRKAKMDERKARKDAEETKKPTADERYAMQTEKLDRQIAHKAEMKKILSAEQYVRWEKMAMQKGKKKKKKAKKAKGKKHRNNR